MTDSFTVVKAGLETSIQDYPGRIGYWALGIPPSGPMDSLAFRLANLLVGNAAGAAALEMQFIGPAMRFERDGVIAFTGADMKPMLEERAIPLWRSVPVRAGQILRCGFAHRGARSYLAFDGGIETPSVTMHFSITAPAPTSTSSHRIDSLRRADGSMRTARPTDEPV